MKLPRRVRRVVVFVSAFLVGTWVAGYFLDARAEPTTAPATAPTTAPSTQAVIDPAAVPVVKRLAAAYSKPPIRINGTIVIDFDVAEMKQNETVKLTSAALSSMQFTHEIEGQAQIVGDGKQINVLDLKRKQYVTSNLEKTKARIEDDPISLSMLRDQNPGLLLALTEGSSEKVFEGRKVGLEKSEGEFDVLAVDDGEVIGHWFVDKASGRIDRIEFDFGPMLEKQGATHVHRATSTLRYEKPDLAPQLDATAFTFRPPADAIEATAEAKSAALGDGELGKLVGKPAPAFDLFDIDENKVNLESLKGKVVVLDFWATWCGPCRQALPILDRIGKEQQGKDVVIYAVNVGEDASTIRSFLTESKLALPVLLDKDQSTSKRYLVTGIPQTVVIGRDGKVRFAHAGLTTEYGAEIREQIEAAQR